VLTPELPVAKADYLRGGMTEVHGWLTVSTAVYLACLEVLQQQRGLRGDVCEIGVHHGKSFLAMAIGMADGERCVAVDPFADDDRTAFEGHLTRFGVRDAADVVVSSSLALEAQGFLGHGRRFRMFSIDGCHAADAVRNDLELAERTVVAGGVVVLDDVLHRHLLGVVTGLFEYWGKGGTLVPAVLVPDGLVLARTPEEADGCRRLMADAFATGQEQSDVPFGPGVVDVYGQASWVIRDVEGRETLLGGPGHRLPREEPLLQVPQSYLRQLEERVNAPLAAELAVRYPRLAGAVRAVMRPVRRLRPTGRR
jgi:hypothetical protein